MSSTLSLHSLWDSRFEDCNISEEAFISTYEAQFDVMKISSILAAAGRSLPLIHSHELKFYSHLGAGANFKVNCEVYTKGDETSAPELVAVKYLRLPSVPGPETAKFYDGIMRELRVLTHPPFRYHECLLKPLAYSWSTSPETGVHPYLVVDYSDHGTLAQYLQRITPPVDECRQFALDVAVGLQALHHTRIVHGDLKPDNVLIFNCAGERPQVAKLADFGASMFEDDLEEGPVSYKDTSRYKAPEHAGRLGIPVYKAAQTKKGYYKADIYSIGLLIWEVMNNGDDYCESEWLLEGESELRFLDRICEIEKDGLLNRARLFCENRFRDLGQPVVQKTVMETFEVTLRDQAALRADIDTLVEKLANGISKTRPKPAFPRIRSLPLSKDGDGPDRKGWKLPIIRTKAPLDERARKQQRSSGASLSASKSDHAINVLEESERIVRARQKPTFKLTTAKPSALTESPSEVKGLSSLLQREPAPTATEFSRQSFNVFQVFATAAFPPWSVQSAIFQDLMTQTKKDYADVESADAHFQLSLCYQTGFGVEPDTSEVLCHLRKAAIVNPIAASVRRRLEIACNDQSLMKLDFATEIDHEIEALMSIPLYFSTRLRLHQKSLAKITEQRTWKCDTVQFTLLDLDLLDFLSHRSDCHQPCVISDAHGVILRRENLLDLAAEVGNPTVIRTLISNERWGEAELRSALLKACEYGNFVAAELLSVHCPQLSYTSDKISPLHWLIMFDQDEARRLAVLLVLGSGGDIENANGICKDLVNVMPPPGSDPIIFPEHCLQLAGSPLHWAVGARNLALVTILVELGANPHQRWSPNRAPENDYPSHHHPGFTPLELAVAWHMPEIVDAFWKRTPSSLQMDLLESSDVPHYLGQLSLPSLRYIIHGANHVHALNDTIHTLQAFAFDLCRRNKQGQSVFMAALADPDQDIYVLREILAASGSAERVTSDGKNAVTLVAATSLTRRNNPQRMELAIEMTTDINDTDDSGWNALHYLAVEDNATLCKMILRHGNLDINRQNAKGASAVHLAATFNAATVLVLLLHSGADIETWDQDGYTPLALAILNRRRSAIKVLVEAGANTFLRNCEGASKIGALHIAVSGPSSLDSIAAHLLETYPVFRSSSHLNLVDGFDWTPLHRAAYFGDHEGVAALLSHGADSEAQCCRRFPIAPGRTALDVASNLLQKISTDSGLGSDHASIITRGAVAIAAFKLRLEEVKLVLTQKRGYDVEVDSVPLT